VLGFSIKGEAVKLKILLITMLGVAGVASSFALANGGRDHGRRDLTDTTSTTTCQHTSVLGTAAPQSLVVTVKKAGWRHSPFAPNQVITVSVGGSGDTVNVIATGCGSDSTLTARGASIFVARPDHHGHGDGDGGNGHHTTTTDPVTTVVTDSIVPVSTATTTTTG
jgi:hypothetical protein